MPLTTTALFFQRENFRLCYILESVWIYDKVLSRIESRLLQKTKRENTGFVQTNLFELFIIKSDILSDEQVRFISAGIHFQLLQHIAMTFSLL